MLTKLLAACPAVLFVLMGLFALGGHPDPAGADGVLVPAQYEMTAPAPDALLLIDKLRGWIALVSLGIAYRDTVSRTLDKLVDHIDWWGQHLRQVVRRDPIDTLRRKAGAAPRTEELTDDRPPA